MTTLLFIPPGASAAQKEKLRKQFKAQQADPKIQRELAERNRPPEQLQALEIARPITSQHWQQFERLLTKSGFQQLPSYESSSVIDGADWLLEVHQASGYHMVARHSPDENDGFRKACEYLIDLSSVRHEERY